MAVLPRLIRPMLATLRPSLPAGQDRYGWEFKWDGVRAIAHVGGGEVRLVSRNDKDMAASYPELAVLAGRVDAPVILDGEIVALRAGRPDFGALQSRMHVRRPPARLIGETPVQLYRFDLLHHGPDSLLGLPYTERRDRLEALGLDADPVRTPPWYRDDADIVLATSLQHGLEGVVGKPLASRYHPGGRRDWIRIKNIRHQEVIIGGWKPGQGGRAHTIGSLLLGVYDERPAAVREERRHGVHRGDAHGPAAAAGPARARYQPVRHAGAAPVCLRRALGGTAAGRRGRVHRVDR